MRVLDPWIWTNSGREFHYTDPQPDQIEIEDIATGLAKICRFGGQTDDFYSVADHCMNLVRYCKDNFYHRKFQLGVLLHDASEAYLSDIPAPAKCLLPEYVVLEKKVYSAIAKKFDAPDSTEFHRNCSRIDKCIVRNEAEKFFTKNVPTWTQHFEPLDINIRVSRSWQSARDKYLEMFEQLTRYVDW